MSYTNIIVGCAGFICLGCLSKDFPSTPSGSSNQIPLVQDPLYSAFVPKGYTLIFNDEFNAKHLDTIKWNYRLGAKITGGYSSVQVKENVFLEKGSLVIKGIFQDPKQNKQNTGGGVISKEHFRYGYYESRFKTQAGAFWHSSFWTYNTKNKTRNTEIDVFERDSQYDMEDGVIKIRQNVIQHSSGKPITLKGSIKLPLNFDPSAEFHVYGMLWEKEQVKFYVDGKLTNTISYSPAVHPHDDNAIWLSMIARNTAASSTDCLVDYVRYYKHNTKED